MLMPSDTDLAALEDRIQRSLRTLDLSGLDILGYGEITTVFRLKTSAGDFACKRFPVFHDPQAADAHRALIGQYVEALTGRGLRVIESGFGAVPLDGGRQALYLVQPILDPRRIGPELFRSLDVESASERYAQILHALKGVVSDRLAPDGQLSNWVFLDEGLSYLDISTPFMRGADGRELCNWEVLSSSVIGGLLRPLWPYYRSKIPETVAFYYSLRGQTLDFLGNLRKEKLDHLIEPFLPIANTTLGLQPALTLADVKKYYNDNADFYALLMRLFRVNRAFHRHVLRRTYPNFIPPHIARNKF